MEVTTIITKALQIFISIYILLKSEFLNVSTKLTLFKALIRSVMTSACPAWEFVAESYILKLRHLQSKVFCTIDNLPRCTPIYGVHVVFKILYLHDFVPELCS
jgi:hypothetical protein